LLFPFQPLAVSEGSGLQATGWCPGFGCHGGSFSPKGLARHAAHMFTSVEDSAANRSVAGHSLRAIRLCLWISLAVSTVLSANSGMLLCTGPIVAVDSARAPAVSVRPRTEDTSYGCCCSCKWLL
jgi:hypothetical protein